MTMRYQTTWVDDAGLCQRMRAIARDRRRFGYRRLHVLLKREGYVINNKKLFRLYREEKLLVRPRGGRRRAIGTQAPMTVPMAPNDRWSLDFVSDQLRCYDLSIAGVPVHSTVFRPVTDESLRHNPFRVFTSLLRLELIEDAALREAAARILSERRIFTSRVLELVEVCESDGGPHQTQAEEFVREVLKTFRWHSDATVTLEACTKLHNAHRLIADVVSFRGPHINHLTPRMFDIDVVQAMLPQRGITPKAVIEGRPRRKCPILLRQTSFKSLQERTQFRAGNSEKVEGVHTARFGEIEQRGIALTPKGRKLYDELLASVRSDVQVDAIGSHAGEYESNLAERFRAFPDTWAELRDERLAYFRCSPTAEGLAAARRNKVLPSLEELLMRGHLRFDPIVYEDFLPVSAAGIFQSNLGTDEQQNYAERANWEAFEDALGAKVADEFALYAQAEKYSLDEALSQLSKLAAKAQ